MKISLFCFLILLSYSCALQWNNHLVEMESDIIEGLPYQWIDLERTPQDKQIELIIAMKTNNRNLLEDRLMEVSTPSSMLYGQYWTRDEVNNYLSPPEKHLSLVIDWLNDYNIYDISISGNRFITVKTSIKIAEELLSVEFRTLSHSTRDFTLYRSLTHYKVPYRISKVIEIIGGVNRIPKFPRVLDLPALGSTNPEVIQSLYNITIPPSYNGNLQAVASFLNQYYSPSDLSDFEKLFNLPLVAIAQTYGPNDPNFPGVEASLDVQYLLGVGNCSTETWVISTPGTTSSGNEPFLTFLNGLNNLTSVPQLISMSYQDYEYTVSESYANVVNQEFMAYALQGTTFITGSGDWGVGCDGIDQCDTFTADFPSSSPYVVSTGATTFDKQGLEEGVSFSSGGFSNYFTRPSFQDDAVNAFLAQPNLPPSSYFNSSGRGFPDISAIGTGFVVYTNGVHTPVGGTSASTPTFGSMLAMINAMRLAANQPVLGYVLPFIYQAWSENPASFNDITTSQPQDEGCCSARFDTVTGWDPYTGLGTPNFYILSQLAMDPSMFKSFSSLK